MRVFLQDNCWVVHTPFFVWPNFNFLHRFQWITLPTQSCLYDGVVSSLSPHNLHLLFYFVLSTLALIWLVLMALFWAAIRRNSVSLSGFPFFNHVHIFLCGMWLVGRIKRRKGCFSYHFCFLVISVLLILVLSVLLLMAVISFSPCFSMSSCVIILMRQRCLQCRQVMSLLSFLNTYSLSTSSLVCKALCRVISFLVLWSIF